jgi:hypothetical protein
MAAVREGERPLAAAHKARAVAASRNVDAVASRRMTSSVIVPTMNEARATLISMKHMVQS